jgi:L-ascorbate metabolism protein UlaG (beta-lactamase superfamily)
VSREALVIAPRGCGATVRRARPADVLEMDAGDTYTVAGVHLEAFPALHDGRRHPLARRADALGFVLAGPTSVYFAGDTDVFDGMAALAGRVDVALLPIWGWGPRLPPGHLGPESAARAAALIRPAVAVPIHWGTLRSVGAGSDAAWQAPPVAFAAAVASRGLATRVQVLAPGEAMPLPPLVAAAS